MANVCPAPTADDNRPLLNSQDGRHPIPDLASGVDSSRLLSLRKRIQRQFATELYLFVFGLTYNIVDTLFHQVIDYKVKRMPHDLTAPFVADPLSLPMIHHLKNTTLDKCAAVHNATNSSNSFDSDVVQENDAYFDMVCNLRVCPILIVSLLTIGILSDRYGRRLTFILPPIGTLLSIGSQLCILYYHLDISFCTLSQGLYYLFGGYPAVQLGSFAYIADITTTTSESSPKQSSGNAVVLVADERRKKTGRMIGLEFIMYISAGICHASLGFLIKRFGFFLPYFIAIGLQVVAFFYAIFIIPEPAGNTQPVEGAGNSGIPSPAQSCAKKLRAVLANVLNLLTRSDKGDFSRRWKIGLLLTAYMLHEVTVGTGLLTFFVFNAPLCLDSALLGYYLMIKSGSEALGMLGGVLLTKCGLSSEWILLLSRLSWVAYAYVLAISNTLLMLYLGPSLVGILSRLLKPLTKSLLTDCVEQNERGTILATFLTLCVLCQMLSAVVMNEIYAATAYWMNGFVFIVQGFVGTVAVVITMYYVYRARRERNVVQRSLLINSTDVHY